MHIVSRLQQHPLVNSSDTNCEDVINLNNHLIGCISTFNNYNNTIQ